MNTTLTSTMSIGIRNDPGAVSRTAQGLPVLKAERLYRNCARDSRSQALLQRGYPTLGTPAKRESRWSGSFGILNSEFFRKKKTRGVPHFCTNDEGIELSRAAGDAPDKRYSPLPATTDMQISLPEQISQLAIPLRRTASDTIEGSVRPMKICFLW